MLTVMEQASELEKVMEKVENYLREHYVDEGVKSSEGVCGKANSVDVPHLHTFFNDLKSEGILPNNDLIIQYTADDDENRFECMDTRFVLFNGYTPLLTIVFDQVIGSSYGRYQGLLKEGFQQIVEAALKYSNRPAKSLVVDYTIIAGESEITKSRLLQSDEQGIESKELIHDYFSDFGERAQNVRFMLLPLTVRTDVRL